MMGLVKTAPEPGAVEWREWPDPSLPPGHVMVEVERAGVCSTDVAIARWTYRGRRPVEIPSLLGHEAAGVVSAVGDGVDDIATGDRVALQVIWGRPHSAETLRGLGNLDPDWIHLGGSRFGGAFAHRISVPAERVIRIPDGIGWDDAALLEPLAVALHAMELVGVGPGDTFALVGPGPFGLLMSQIARAAGASRVVVAGLAGVDEGRLEVARSLGADSVVSVDRDREAAAEAMLAAAGPADVVIDGGGTPESTWTALEVAGPGARVGLFGFTREATIEPLRQVIRKGLTLRAVSAARREHYGRALRLVETGAVRPSAIATHRLQLERVAEGIDLAGDRVAAKVLLER
jgi:threonine dehydrogenase-like Zn-dependent dehydrogenase